MNQTEFEPNIKLLNSRYNPSTLSNQTLGIYKQTTWMCFYWAKLKLFMNDLVHLQVWSLPHQHLNPHIALWRGTYGH